MLSVPSVHCYQPYAFAVSDLSGEFEIGRDDLERTRIEALVFKTGLLIGSRADLDSRCNSLRTFAMECFVNLPDCGEDYFQFPFHIRPVGVEFHLEPRGPDHLVGALDLVSYGDAHTDRNDLNFSKCLHMSCTLTAFVGMDLSI